MKLRKFLFLFCVITGVALVVSYKLYAANLAIAIVNGVKISERDFAIAVTGNLNYYKNAARTYGDDRDFSSPELLLELKRATLEQLIVNALIAREVRTRLGDSYATVIANKIRGAESNQDFKSAATAIYGLSYRELKEQLLVPMAEAELLEGKLFLEKLTLEDWVAGAKENAQVTILDQGFSWSKNGVVAE